MCQSSAKLIGQDFVVPLGQIFPIQVPPPPPPPPPSHPQIVHWPESLVVEVVEGSTLRTTTLAQVGALLLHPT